MDPTFAHPFTSPAMDDGLILNLDTGDNLLSKVGQSKKGGRWTDRCVARERIPIGLSYSVG